MNNTAAQAALNQMIARSQDKPELFFPTEVAALKSCAEMLKATPEPKPDFFVGWKGKTRGGYDAEIYGKKGGAWFGASNLNGAWEPDTWQKSGHWMKDSAEEVIGDLIPNTPPEPEIWWFKNDVLFSQSEYDEIEERYRKNMKKVSVQAIP